MTIFNPQFTPGPQIGQGPDEAEALQTDVMRFMAILGLCLMVVFALVQSIPVSQTDATPKLATISTLEQKNVQLQEKLKELQKENQILTKKIEEKKTDLSRQNLEPMPVKEVASAPNLPKPNPSSSEISPLDRVDETQKVGFTLHFKTNDALLTLVKQHRIKAYAVTENQAWNLTLVNGSIQAVKTSFPKTFYEMERRTVPPDFQRAMGRVAIPKGTQTLTWGVVLPGQIQSQIMKLMQTRKGGDMIITETGSVEIGTTVSSK